MPKPKKEKEEGPKKLTVYTTKLTPEQAEKLEHLCDERCYGFKEVAYADFAFEAPHDKINLVCYKGGKLVVQGKGTEEFVQNTIEAQITGKIELGYEEFNHPEWFEAHAGMDEAGKGDLFGPLVSCCVIGDAEMVREWRQAGVKDSKTMTDATIMRLEKIILATPGVVVVKRWAAMEKYNELMSRPRANLNKLLAWYHARALQEALEKHRLIFKRLQRPDAQWGLVDQFSERPLVQEQMKKDGWGEFDLRMRTKAESDPVVAAASVCARAEFVRQIRLLSKDYGEELKKGASAEVKKQAHAIVAKFGPEGLPRFAKMHFRTASEVLGLPVPEKKAWVRRPKAQDASGAADV